MTRTQNSRERFLLLHDLRRQRPTARMRVHTERAIRQIELELAGGREVAGRAATERGQEFAAH